MGSGVSRISARGVLKVRSDTKSGGGGGGGGVQFTSGPIRKVGAFVWRTANTLSLMINGYNFGRGGRGVLKHPEHPLWIRHWWACAR